MRSPESAGREDISPRRPARRRTPLESGASLEENALDRRSPVSAIDATSAIGLQEGMSMHPLVPGCAPWWSRPGARPAASLAGTAARPNLEK